MASTILIIDDNPDDIEITKIVLAELGRQEEVAAMLHGRGALEYLRKGYGNGLPSLILLDLKMPGLSGIDTLRQIRADEQLKHIPVVIVTSSSLMADEKEAYDAGADNFLNKAFNIDLFSSNLNVILRRYLTN